MSEHIVDHEQVQQLIEANEHLVLAALQAHVQRAANDQKSQGSARTGPRDSLTRPPNRLILQDQLSHAITKAQRDGSRLALLLVKLNQLRNINDTLGYLAGDQALQVAAQCISSAVHDADTVSRYGGDEFIILLENVSGPAEAMVVVDEILTAIQAAKQVGLHLTGLTASVGISLYPDDGQDAEALLALASEAVGKAGQIQRGSFAFAKSMPDTSATDGVDLATGLAPLPEINSPKIEQRHRYRRIADKRMLANVLAVHELKFVAEETLRRQTAFMAMLAHELRAPLGPIQNAALLLEGSARGAVGTARIHALLARQITHMKRLLDDVFDMSRIATGKMRVDQKPIDLLDTIRQAIDIVEGAIQARQQVLHCTLPSSPVLVKGDPVRLVQVFANLLHNASKYSPENTPITVSVAVRATAIEICVADSGIGITADVLPDVFRLFVQDAHAARYNGQGLGIGLALVKDLVEAHGGTVAASSEGTGCGSRFTVTLPAHAPGNASLTTS